MHLKIAILVFFIAMMTRYTHGFLIHRKFGAHIAKTDVDDFNNPENHPFPNNDFDELDLKDFKRKFGPRAEIIRSSDGTAIGCRTGNSVSSLCCTTDEVYYWNDTVTDVFGRGKTIAQRDHIDTFQFIRHGLCGTRPSSCPGQCEQIYVTMPLVVHPPARGQTVTFGFFKIPGYCVYRVPMWRG